MHRHDQVPCSRGARSPLGIAVLGPGGPLPLTVFGGGGGPFGPGRGEEQSDDDMDRMLMMRILCLGMIDSFAF